MVRHIVTVRTTDSAQSTDLERLRKELVDLLDSLDGVLAHTVGQSAGLGPESCDFAAVIDFDNEKTLSTYLNHPTHRVLATETLLPMTEHVMTAQLVLGSN